MASDQVEYMLRNIKSELEGISDGIRKIHGRFYELEHSTLGPMNVGVWLLVLIELGKIIYGHFSK
jgi:hypothetical protein